MGQKKLRTKTAEGASRLDSHNLSLNIPMDYKAMKYQKLGGGIGGTSIQGGGAIINLPSG
jgi:hypothetical protein